MNSLMAETNEIVAMTYASIKTLLNPNKSEDSSQKNLKSKI
jgi:hypothetical protein